MQLIGILIGQLMFGVMGDWIGRKATMLIDMSVILLGVILLTVSNGTTINVRSGGREQCVFAALSSCTVRWAHGSAMCTAAWQAMLQTSNVDVHLSTWTHTFSCFSIPWAVDSPFLNLHQFSFP